MIPWLKSRFYYLISRRQASSDTYFDVLDGWRGISIILVLSAHLLPLGPKFLQLNVSAGILGMSLFFTLSGFLITNFLIHRPNVHDFIIRRFFRIIPLAWLYLAIALPFLNADVSTFAAHFLFYGNWPPMPLIMHGTSHFWSLCVEMQFYVGIAFLFLLLKERTFLLLIVLCLFFTGYRMYNGVHVAINTYYRIDEILVGCIIAIVYNNVHMGWLSRLFKVINPYIVLVLLMLSCHPDTGALNYARPYLAATLVAITLYNSSWSLVKFLDLRIFIYIASISYALYVIHPILLNTWLGSGDTVIKYLKRPLLFLILFGLAHLSTFYYEKYWINLGKRLTAKPKAAV